MENDPTVKGSVNKIYVGTETRDLYRLARSEQDPSWNVSTYVVESELAKRLSETTQKSVSKTKNFPLGEGYQNPIVQYEKMAEEIQAQKEEAKKMLPELKRR